MFHVYRNAVLLTRKQLRDDLCKCILHPSRNGEPYGSPVDRADRREPCLYFSARNLRYCPMSKKQNYMDDKAEGKSYSGPRQGDAPLSALGEEAVFKRQQCAVNQLAHLMERYANRLPFQTRGLGERYVNGRLKLCIKLRSRFDGHQFHLIVSRCNVGFKDEPLIGNEVGHFAGIGLCEVVMRPAREQMLSVFESESDEFSGFENCDKSRHQTGPYIEGRNGNPVFFVSVEEMKGAKVDIPSRVCTCISDELFASSREELYYFSNLGVVCVHVMAEGEGNPGCHPSKFVGENGENVVEGVAEVGQDVANHNFQLRRKALVDSDPVDLFSGLDIDIGDDFIRVSRDKLLNVGLELVDFGFGPFGLGVTSA